MLDVHQPGRPGQERARLHPRASEADQFMGCMEQGRQCLAITNAWRRQRLCVRDAT